MKTRHVIKPVVYSEYLRFKTVCWDFSLCAKLAKANGLTGWFFYSYTWYFEHTWLHVCKLHILKLVSLLLKRLFTFVWDFFLFNDSVATENYPSITSLRDNNACAGHKRLVGFVVLHERLLIAADFTCLFFYPKKKLYAVFKLFFTYKANWKPK